MVSGIFCIVCPFADQPGDEKLENIHVNLTLLTQYEVLRYWLLKEKHSETSIFELEDKTQR